MRSITFASAGLALLALLLAPMASSAQVCGPLDDPMSAKCSKSGPRQRLDPPQVPGLQHPQTPPKHYPSAVLPLNGEGKRACALMDSESGRCVIHNPTPEEYDSAVQTGIDAARAAMGIQRDALDRAAAQGVFPGGSGSPFSPGGGGSPFSPGGAGAVGAGSAAPGGKSTAAGCVSRNIAILERTGQALTMTLLREVGQACGVR